MTIEIEKNIPIPKGKIGYPFEQMEVGDSFFIKRGDNDVNKLRASIASLATYYVNRYDHKKKFATKVLVDGVRCWRIK